MKNNLLDTKEKIDQAVASFKGLLTNPGFILLKQIVDANIELVSAQILEGIEDETKETIDRLRDKLKVYKEVINTPQEMIARFESEEAIVPEDDPFDTIESLEKSRKLAVDIDIN